MKYSPALKTVLIALIAIIPAIIFYYSFGEMAVNVPFQDDFDALLEPTVKLQTGNYSRVEGFWEILYTQDDERRIVINRLTSYLIQLTTGNLDLRILMTLGLASYLLFIWMLAEWFRQEQIYPVYFLPIPFLLFTPINYTAVFWAMIPLQHIAVFVWAFLALWCMSRASRGSFTTGLMVAIIALYSDVSGSFILLSGALVLLAQKKLKRLVVWLVVLGGLVGYYYYNLKVPDFRPPISENLKHFDSLLQILLTMPGMIVDVFPTLPDRLRLAFAGLAGLVSLGVLAGLLVPFLRQLLVRKQQPAENDVWIWGSLLFIFTVFAAFALGRAAEGGGSILIPRYKHMFVYWTIFCYLLLLKTPLCKRNVRKLGTLALGISLLYFATAYFQNWEAIDYYRKVLLTDAYQWKNNRAIPSSPIYVAMREPVDAIYEQSIEAGVYRMPSFYFESLLTAPVQGTTPVTIEDSPDFIRFHFPEIQRGLSKNEGAYVLLQAGSEVHVFPTKNSHRTFLGAIRSGQYYHHGATSISILKKYLGQPRYTLYAGVIRDGKYFRLATNTPIDL
jgi:hypothetical protein